MQKLRMLFALCFSAILAVGMFSTPLAAQQSCTPTFTGFVPSEIQGGKTSAVTLYGYCLPTSADVRNKSVIVGFNDKVNPKGLPVNIAMTEARFLVLSVTAPVVQADSGRKLWVELNGKKYEGPELTIRGQARELPKEQVTTTVDFGPVRRQIQQVDGKADKALGIASQTAEAARTLQASEGEIRRAIDGYATLINQNFGPNGAVTKRFVSDEAGLAEHAEAIRKLRQAVDDINTRQPQQNVNPQDLTALQRQIDELRTALGAANQTLEAIERVKVKTGGKTELGKTAGIQPRTTQANALPTGGVQNPIQ